MINHAFHRSSFAWVIFFLMGCSLEPSPPQSPSEQVESFRIAENFRIELVASEPMVQEPVAMVFDAYGRLWVVEMRGFMPDIDRNGEEAPVGRVSVLMDTDQDGIMDSSVVFADSLVLPRAVAVVEGGALIAEGLPLWFYEDTNGDLVADSRTLVDSTYGDRGIVEHSPNGLWRGMDGWYYNVKSDQRYKRSKGEWVSEKTEFRGQWGISHDDVGRLFYNYNWSQLHADLVPPNYLNRNPHHTPSTGIDHGLTLDRSVFPVRPNLAANRGNIPGTLDASGKLREFTSACSPLVYRGDALPEEFSGNVFVCEPTGNLIRRNIITENEYILSATNAYEGKEFLASTDERFRPVALANGPDGALYIADMYRGIIQHGLYMTEYLRNITLERNLDEHIHLGRIWRIVPDTFKEKEPIALPELSGEELVACLQHPNGWIRDMAMQIMVDRGEEAVVPLLINAIVDTTNTFQSRIQSMWTLDGLGKVGSEVYFQALDDPNDQVKALAIRLLEKQAISNKEMLREMEERLSAMIGKSSATVNLQIALSAGTLRTPASLAILKDIADTYYHLPLMRDAIISSLTNHEMKLLSLLIGDQQWQEEDPGRAIMLEVLAAATAKKRDPKEISSLLARIEAGPAKVGWQETAMLNGLTIHAGDMDGRLIELNAVPSLIENSSLYDMEVQGQIDKLSGMLSWPGKTPSAAPDPETIQVAVDAQQYAFGRQQYLNICAGCHGNDGKGLNRFAPPLRNSEWVLGSEKKLALILIHGMEGPVMVDGKEYDVPDILPEMPSFSVFDDEKLAAIMTYIRTEWGHQANPVKPGTVGKSRVRNQGKLTPWTQQELNDLPDE